MASSYVLVVDDDWVLVYRVPSLSGLEMSLEATVTRSGRAWLVRTPRGDLLEDNLRGAVAEALDLFRDCDRGPGDPGDLLWEGPPAEGWATIPQTEGVAGSPGTGRPD